MFWHKQPYLYGNTCIWSKEKCSRVLRVHSKASSPKFINKLLNIISIFFLWFIWNSDITYLTFMKNNKLTKHVVCVTFTINHLYSRLAVVILSLSYVYYKSTHVDKTWFVAKNQFVSGKSQNQVFVNKRWFKFFISKNCETCNILVCRREAQVGQFIR